MQKPRIFIGLIEIAGYYNSLAFGLRQKGYQVTLAGATSHTYGYESGDNKNPLPIRVYDALLKNSTAYQLSKQNTLSSLAKRKLSVLLTKLAGIILFIWAFSRHEVFIFGFGSSFFPENYDLPILKALRKRVICNIAHGSEARPPYINGVHVGELSYPISTSKLSSIRKIAKRIKRRCLKIENHADIVVGAPLTSHFLEQSFINTFYLGVPFKGLSHNREENLAKKEKIRILHCPSNPIVKGTSLIRSAITSLQSKGYAIEFVELIGKPNKEVLEELRICDFVIDQSYSDFPLAGFATEAAWFAKPAVVGGYGWQSLKSLIPEHVFPPSHLCHPENLESAIEKLIIDEQYRHTLGQQACDFVESVWSIQKFAERYLQLINGEIPEIWWATPGQIPYIQGCGISENTLFKVLSQLLLSGTDILQLRDKPSLENAFIEFYTFNIEEK